MPKHNGRCRLTGHTGKLIDAHLIPKALTRPEEPGLPFVQGGGGTRPTRRWSSWYDNRLVTQEGEDILTDLDTWAIPELRKHKLVWSGWGPIQELSAGNTIADTGAGFRRIYDIDAHRLRMFFLSLLWRSAATTREEFSEITIPAEDLEKLGECLVSGTEPPVSFYPIQLTQLSTLGETHNLSPIRQTKTILAVGNEPERRIPIFRFYFDGLIAHIHIQSEDDGYAESLGSLIVGHGRELAVTTITYEQSFQKTNLAALKLEQLEQWPDVMTKLLKPKS